MTTTENYTIDPSARVLLRDLHLSVGNILRRAALPGDLLNDGPVSVTPAQAAALWEAIAAEADDPDLPITIGQAISVESFSPPVFAAICSPNLAVAAARIATYKALIGPMRLIVTPTERGTELELRWPAHHRVPEVLVTTEIVWWVALARLATRTPVQPVAATSPHTPSSPQALSAYLGTPIVASGRVTVTFSARDAARPFVTANEPMWAVFEPELRRRLAQLGRDATTSERVQAALLELLPSGRSSIDEVARELCVSPRTLQRQLRRDGASFQAVLHRTRESLARHYLADEHLSTTEIAFLLGYDEPNSFHRAFQAWTGQTPHRVRLASA